MWRFSVEFLDEIILNIPRCLDLMHNNFLSRLSGLTIDSYRCTFHSIPTLNQQIIQPINATVCTAAALYAFIQQIPIRTLAIMPDCLFAYLSPLKQISWYFTNLLKNASFLILYICLFSPIPLSNAADSDRLTHNGKTRKNESFLLTQRFKLSEIEEEIRKELYFSKWKKMLPARC
jgi:hypothetical protein